MSKYEEMQVERIKPPLAFCVIAYEALLSVYRQCFSDEPRALLLPIELMEQGYQVYAAAPTLTRLPIILIPIESAAFAVIGNDGIVVSEPT